MYNICTILTLLYDYNSCSTDIKCKHGTYFKICIYTYMFLLRCDIHVHVNVVPINVFYNDYKYTKTMNFNVIFLLVKCSN